jgi:hypothetical protein
VWGRQSCMVFCVHVLRYPGYDSERQICPAGIGTQVSVSPVSQTPWSFRDQTAIREEAFEPGKSI